MIILNEYIDRYGHLSPWGENGILFTAEYLRLKQIANNRKTIYDREHGLMAIEHIRVSENEFRAIDEPNSHDNHTAIVSISAQMGFDYHKKFFWKHWWRRIHPRDLVYYLYLKGGVARTLVKPFLFILSAAMIYSCWDTRKKPEGLRTDGKLLAWLRLNTINMPLTKKICDNLVTTKFGGWHNIFRIYFKDLNHPNVKLAKQIYSPILKDR